MTPTPTTPTRSKRSASRLAACTMTDEFPPPGSRNESLLACPKAAGDGPARGSAHVLNQRVTARRQRSRPSLPERSLPLKFPGNREKYREFSVEVAYYHHSSAQAGAPSGPVAQCLTD